MNAETNNPNNVQRRKLSRNWRKANLAYQIIIGAIGGLNAVLTSISGYIDIPTYYFQVLSVLMSFIPLGWSRLLDLVKSYEDDLTPNATPTTTPDRTMREVMIHSNSEELLTLEK